MSPTEPLELDAACRRAFLELYDTRMPFGSYQGTRLVDLPERYLVWWAGQGFPPGKLGNQLREIYEIKLNGLEYLFDPLRNR